MLTFRLRPQNYYVAEMGFWKNIQREVKKLRSLDVKLILYMEFDISENYSKSSFGKEDHELIAKIFDEWEGVIGNLENIYEKREKSWCSLMSYTAKKRGWLREPAMGSKEDITSRWSYL